MLNKTKGNTLTNDTCYLTVTLHTGPEEDPDEVVEVNAYDENPRALMRLLSSYADLMRAYCAVEKRLPDLYAEAQAIYDAACSADDADEVPIDPVQAEEEMDEMLRGTQGQMNYWFTTDTVEFLSTRDSDTEIGTLFDGLWGVKRLGGSSYPQDEPEYEPDGGLKSYSAGYRVEMRWVQGEHERMLPKELEKMIEDYGPDEDANDPLLKQSFSYEFDNLADLKRYFSYVYLYRMTLYRNVWCGEKLLTPGDPERVAQYLDYSENEDATQRWRTFVEQMENRPLVMFLRAFRHLVKQEMPGALKCDILVRPEQSLEWQSLEGFGLCDGDAFARVYLANDPCGGLELFKYSDDRKSLWMYLYACYLMTLADELELEVNGERFVPCYAGDADDFFMAAGALECALKEQGYGDRVIEGALFKPDCDFEELAQKVATLDGAMEFDYFDSFVELCRFFADHAPETTLQELTQEYLGGAETWGF